MASSAHKDLENENKILLGLMQQELEQYYPGYNEQNAQPELIENHQLKELLVSIKALQTKLSKKKSTETEEVSFYETLGLITEGSEIVSDLVEESGDCMYHINQLQHAKPIAHTVYAAFTGVGIVSMFFYGIECLKEAYQAYKNVATTQRKTKIMTGVFAGLASIGTAIVGALFLAGVGALGTAAALFAAPIVLAAISVGIFTATLYRDSYVLHQIRMQVKKLENTLHARNKELTETYSALIKSATPLELFMELENLQTSIHLHEKLLQENPKEKKKLTHILSNLYTKREEIIQGNDLFKHHFNNPRIQRLTIERRQLTQSLEELKQVRNDAKSTAVLSTFCLIGVGLCLGAVLATGIGALIIGGLAACIFSAMAIKGAYDFFKGIYKRQSKKIEPKTPESNSHEDSISTKKPSEIFETEAYLANQLLDISGNREKNLSQPPHIDRVEHVTPHTTEFNEKLPMIKKIDPKKKDEEKEGEGDTRLPHP